ncbi:hypothetical protein PP512_gp61 [Gordonia phage Denise]|uniref:Uncharacterized protein n=1 Tax=Gordonia phage Denise TaxID=2652879 RepID=A0A5P8DCF3_9CAUD|nr:hypothetical protein PP512_gp61 [Gordonia phage Denise]QFP96676.1 hypothetical protein SEA_DENISE_61 [Gordonia phage Denise]
MKPGYLDRKLSRQFQVAPYLSTAKWRPKYAKSAQRTTCDERFAAQHESRGQYGPRARVAHTRTMPDGSKLYLCSAHNQLWRDLDETTKPKRRKS